jgi:hypothetical protein
MRKKLSTRISSNKLGIDIRTQSIKAIFAEQNSSETGYTLGYIFFQIPSKARMKINKTARKHVLTFVLCKSSR